MSIKSVMPSNHLILCQSLLLLPSVFPSLRVFSNKLTLCMKWPEYHSFSFSISPSNEYSGFISFWDWLVWFPCCSRKSQKFFPAPQFESIDFLVLNLYGPTITSILDYWKDPWVEQQSEFLVAKTRVCFSQFHKTPCNLDQCHLTWTSEYGTGLWQWR